MDTSSSLEKIWNTNASHWLLEQEVLESAINLLTRQLFDNVEKKMKTLFKGKCWNNHSYTLQWRVPEIVTRRNDKYVKHRIFQNKKKKTKRLHNKHKCKICEIGSMQQQ